MCMPNVIAETFPKIHKECNEMKLVVKGHRCTCDHTYQHNWVKTFDSYVEPTNSHFEQIDITVTQNHIEVKDPKLLYWS